MRTVAPTVWPTRGTRLVGAWLGLLLLAWGGHGGPESAWAQLSKLLVESNVSTATILVDGEAVGQTNEEGEALLGALRPDRHTVELQKTGYWSAASRVTLEPNLTTSVSLTLMSRPEGTGGSLLITTNVPDAVVQVDGNRVARTGPNGRAFASGLVAGPHRVVVSKDGYRTASRRPVKKGGTRSRVRKRSFFHILAFVLG